jgi:Fe-S-cluster containining protein
VPEFHFECQRGCVKCCNIEGYVYITEDDLTRIAKFLKMTPEDFEDKYVYRTVHLLRLRKPRNAQCLFLKEDGCSIHTVNPVQCRTFPFWPEIVEKAGEWEKTGQMCPGIGKGPLIQIGEAVERASEMKLAYPTIYEGK